MDLDRKHQILKMAGEISNLFLVIGRKIALYKKAKFELANDHITLY